MLALVTQPVDSMFTGKLEPTENIGSIIDDYNLTTFQYNEIIVGFGWGVLEGNQVDNITACIGDVIVLIEDVVKVVKIVIDQGLDAATVALLKAYKQFKTTAGVCIHIGPDVKVLEAFAANFADPSALPGLVKAGITRHLFKLTRELATARKEFKHQQYW